MTCAVWRASRYHSSSPASCSGALALAGGEGVLETLERRVDVLRSSSRPSASRTPCGGCRPRTIVAVAGSAS